MGATEAQADEVRLASFWEPQQMMQTLQRDTGLLSNQPKPNQLESLAVGRVPHLGFEPVDQSNNQPTIQSKSREGFSQASYQTHGIRANQSINHSRISKDLNEKLRMPIANEM